MQPFLKREVVLDGDDRGTPRRRLDIASPPPPDDDDLSDSINRLMFERTLVTSSTIRRRLCEVAAPSATKNLKQLVCIEY